MTSITDLPIDVWSRVFLHIPFSQLLHTFNAIVYSRALNVRLSTRLDAFWMIASSSKQSEQDAGYAPSVHEHRATFEYLLNMGISEDNAAGLVRRANGNIHDAFLYLGWV